MHTASTFDVLHLSDPAGISRYLKRGGWLGDNEPILRLSRAGEGNMNLVIRVETNERSFILKQSRPWVEKYPDIEAPADRIHFETAFYRAVAEFDEIAGGMPQLIGADAAAHVLLLQDLGETSDLASLYADRAEADAVIPPLVNWLSALHNAPLSDELRPRLANRELRGLNHAHLFVIPFADDNGVDLDAISPGLKSMALKLQSNSGYRQALAKLGERYLSDGPCLLHGDYYPGSWLHGTQGPRVIDPEFCFFGPPEYDVGVMAAHLLMVGLESSQVAGHLAAYKRSTVFDGDLACRFAGMEIMRRIIGVAQLPMERSLEQKVRLLAASERLMLEPAGTGLF